MTRTRRLIRAGGVHALAVLAACNLVDDTDQLDQRSDVPGVGLSNKMYPLMNNSVSPLSPINSVTKRVFATACVSKPDGSGPDPGDLGKADAGSMSYLRYAKSRSQVDDALAVKISAAFAAPTAGVSAELEASTESTNRAESIYLVGELFGYTHQVLQASCPLVLTQTATNALIDESALGDVPAADRDRYRAAEFMRACGDGWVHTRLLGAGGTLILEWKSKSAEDKTKIRAELEASFGKPVLGAKIGAAVTLSKGKLASNATMTTTLVARGAIAGMPAPADIDSDPNKLADIVAKLDELVNKLKEPGGAVDNLSPVSARLAAYDGIAPWNGWNAYDADKKNKIRRSLALIKPIAEEMEKFLGLRANLVKELDYDLAQIHTITTVYPNHFNYGGTQSNYAGTAKLRRHGTTAAYPDLAHYKTSFAELKTKLQDEMRGCEDDGAHGFMKCKPSATLPALVAKEIRKWRDNRPGKLDIYQVAAAATSADAKRLCQQSGGELLSVEDGWLTRPYAMATLAANTDFENQHVHMVSDAIAGEKCPSGGTPHSKALGPDNMKVWWMCGQPWSIPTICRKASIWDASYWKDELDLAGL